MITMIMMRFAVITEIIILETTVKIILILIMNLIKRLSCLTIMGVKLEWFIMNTAYLLS